MSDATIITRRISLAPDVDLLPLLGRNDDHLRMLESELDVRVVARGHDITLKGDERQVRKAERALVQLAEIVRAVEHPDMKSFILTQGSEPMLMDAKGFGAFMRAEIAKWGKVVKAAGLRLDER